MEKSIYLYHDRIGDTFMTEDKLADFYTMESCTDVECITAHLQSGQTIYPFYYSTETDSVYTAMDLYGFYVQQHDFRYPSDTFANFMNVSPYDTFNAHYGFYLEEK